MRQTPHPSSILLCCPFNDILWSSPSSFLWNSYLEHLTLKSFNHHCKCCYKGRVGWVECHSSACELWKRSDNQHFDMRWQTVCRLQPLRRYLKHHDDNADKCWERAPVTKQQARDGHGAVVWQLPRGTSGMNGVILTLCCMQHISDH